MKKVLGSWFLVLGCLIALRVSAATPSYTFKSGGGTPDDNSVTSAKIADGAIVNADINASAAIAASKFVGSDIATVGTITTGTWSATAIGVTKGGTGLATLTANNVILGAGTSTPTFVAPGTSGNVLTSNGTTWASSAAAGGSVNQAADYTWTGTHIFNSNDVTLGAALKFGTAADFDPNNGVRLNSNIGLKWSDSGSNIGGGTYDIMIRRRAGHILEINDVTAGPAGGALQFLDMTAPSAPSSGHEIIYAAAGELHAMDDNGHNTIFSPHAKDAPLQLYDTAPGGDYVYRSSNDYLGKVNFINLDRLASKVDALTRGQAPCRIVETYAEYNKRTGEKLKVKEWDQKGAKPEFLKK